MNFKFLSVVFKTILILFLSSNLMARQNINYIDTVDTIENVSLIDYLDSLEVIGEYNYLCDSQKLKNIKINKKHSSVSKTLNSCLKNTNFKCEIINNVIIINEKGEQKKTIKISGKIIDENKKPIIGASVCVKGITLGTSSDIDGNFNINLPKFKNLTLQFSFIGMKKKEMVIFKDGKQIIKNLNKIVVTLQEDKKQLDEVVAIGYAKIRKNSFTGSAITVKKEQLKAINPTNIISALNIIDPSFRIKENNDLGSNPNALPEINLRGQSGIGLVGEDISEAEMKNNPNMPTFIMDGFEISVTKLFDMDIDRIESITLLKDAAATAIYGSRAANGVVVITTKEPKAGELSIRYNNTTSLSVPDLSDYNLMNSKEKLQAEIIAGLYDINKRNPYADYDQLNERYQARLRSIESGVNTDWTGKPLRNAISHSHSVSLEGGSKGLRYSLDLNVNNDNGVMKDSYRDRAAIGFKLLYNLNKVSFRNNISYGEVKAKESKYGTYSQYTTLNPYVPYLDEYGNLDPEIDANLSDGNRIINPLFDATLHNNNNTKYREIIEQFSFNYYPSDHFNVKLDAGFSFKNTNQRIFKDPESTSFFGYAIKGSLDDRHSEEFNWNINATMQYINTFGSHNISALLGCNFKESENSSHSERYENFPNGGFCKPTYARDMPNKPISFENTNRLYGFFFGLNYTINNILLADFSGRIDGNSSFGTDKRYAPFWSAGLGANLHKLDYIHDNFNWINRLKIRASYGVTGKADFPQSMARTLYALQVTRWYRTGNGVSLEKMGNEDLKWETTKMLDYGFEFDLFKNIISFKYSRYIKNTEDLISNICLPTSSGFSAYSDNVGELENKGHEMSLRIKLVSTSDLHIFARATYAKNKNELVNISNSMKRYNDAVNELADISTTKDSSVPVIRYYEGASLNSIYAIQSLGIDPVSGREMYRYKDGSTGFEWYGSENIVKGNTEPKGAGSFGFDVDYKGIFMNCSFQYEYGGQRYNSTLQSKIENADVFNNCDKRVIEDRWQNIGDITTMKSLMEYRDYTKTTSRFIQDFDMLSLSALSVGYRFKKEALKKLRLKTLKIQINLSDLFYISTVKRERGLNYPYARRFNFTLNTTF